MLIKILRDKFYALTLTTKVLTEKLRLQYNRVFVSIFNIEISM